MATYEKKLVNLGYMPLKYLRLTPKTSKVIQTSSPIIFFPVTVVTSDKESLSLDLKVCSKTKILVQQKNGVIFFSRNRCGWGGVGGAGANFFPPAPRGTHGTENVAQ